MGWARQNFQSIFLGVVEQAQTERPINGGRQHLHLVLSRGNLRKWLPVRHVESFRILLQFAGSSVS